MLCILTFIWQFCKNWIAAISRDSSDSFRRTLSPACPFIECIAPLLSLIQKAEPFLPFSKKQEKKYFFMIFIYALNVSYTFKFKSAFVNQKCALKNIKSALFLFSAPLFLVWGKLCSCFNREIFQLIKFTFNLLNTFT